MNRRHVSFGSVSSLYVIKSLILTNIRNNLVIPSIVCISPRLYDRQYSAMRDLTIALTVSLLTIFNSIPCPHDVHNSDSISSRNASSIYKDLMEADDVETAQEEIRNWHAYKDSNRRFHNVIWTEARRYIDLVYVPANGTWVKSGEGFADNPNRL